MKTCFRCKLEKPTTDFSKCSQKKDGFCTYCRKCDKEKAQAWKEKNLPRWKERKINSTLKSRRGITLEQRHEMFKAQDGKCKICQLPMVRPNVDHCHETGRIRGLLCNRCNQGIGYLKESIPALKAAIAYLGEG